MKLPYLSEEWFGAAQERVAALRFAGLGLECGLQFDAESAEGHVRWAQTVRGGDVRLLLGELPDGGFELHHSLSHAWQVFNEELNGDDALAGFTVVEDRGDGRYVGPPPPMELGQRPELDELLPVPGASLDVQYEYARGPYGPVSWFMSFVDGRLQSMDLGRCPEPDVVAEATFLQLAQVRQGDISVLDALAAGARVKGSEGALALLAGILESPEFHRAELACGRSAQALAVLGEVSADPNYAATMDELRTITGPPVGL